MIRRTSCLLLVLSLVLAAGAGAQTPLARVEIVRVDTLSPSAYRVLVAVTSQRPVDQSFQPLMFVRDLRTGRFEVAVDDKGQPVLPRLEKPEKPGPGRSEWVVTLAPPLAGRGSSKPARARIALYAVACFVEGRQAWDRTKERDAFRLLPFGSAKTFDDILSMLAGLGWQPAGFTYVGE
jgi:hypothetical protein